MEQGNQQGQDHSEETRVLPTVQAPEEQLEEQPGKAMQQEKKQEQSVER